MSWFSHSNRRCAFAVAGFALYFGLLAFLFVRVHRLSQPARDAEMLRVADPSRLDLGHRWPGESFTWSIPLHNPGGNPICVKAVRPSCGCMNAGLSSFTIESGGYHDVSMRIAMPLEEALPARVHHRVDFVVIGSTGRERVISVPVTAIVRSLAEIEPAIIDLGETLVRGQEIGQFQIKLRPLIPVASIDAFGERGISAEVQRLDEGSLYRITTRGVPRAAGPWSPRLTIRLLDRDDQEQAGPCTAVASAQADDR